MKMPHCIKQNIKLEVFKLGSYGIGENLECGQPLAKVGAQRDREDVDNLRASGRLIYVSNDWEKTMTVTGTSPWGVER